MSNPFEKLSESIRDIKRAWKPDPKKKPKSSDEIGKVHLYTDLVTFVSKEGDEIIKINNNGDIFVKGKLVENNKVVVDGLKEFLSSYGLLVI